MTILFNTYHAMHCTSLHSISDFLYCIFCLCSYFLAHCSHFALCLMSDSVYAKALTWIRRSNIVTLHPILLTDHYDNSCKCHIHMYYRINLSAIDYNKLNFNVWWKSNCWSLCFCSLLLQMIAVFGRNWLIGGSFNRKTLSPLSNILLGKSLSIRSVVLKFEVDSSLTMRWSELEEISWCREDIQVKKSITSGSWL